MNRITFPNLAAVILIVFVVIAVTSTFYKSFIGPDATELLRQATIHDCHRAQARSIVDQEFALEAAKARRRNAETAAASGDKVMAENELATAKRYESIAHQYKELTAVNCEKAYPES